MLYFNRFLLFPFLDTSEGKTICGTVQRRGLHIDTLLWGFPPFLLKLKVSPRIACGSTSQREGYPTAVQNIGDAIYTLGSPSLFHLSLNLLTH